VTHMKGEKNNTEFCGDTERERGRERERERRLGRPGCRCDYNKFLSFTELEW